MVPIQVGPTIFRAPFTAIISGPTQSGKTHHLVSLLQNAQTIIDPPPNRIIYCYEVWQPAFDRLKESVPFIEFNKGIVQFDQLSSQQNNLVILDDLMANCESNDEIKSLFTVGSHHNNISVIFIVQNIFNQGKHFRTLSLNTHYITLFNNARDQTQVHNLARQMYPKKSKFLIEAYEDAVEPDYGYILLDLKQGSKYRVQTGIIPGQQRYIYMVK